MKTCPYCGHADEPTAWQQLNQLAEHSEFEPDLGTIDDSVQSWEFEVLPEDAPLS